MSIRGTRNGHMPDAQHQRAFKDELLGVLRAAQAKQESLDHEVLQQLVEWSLRLPREIQQTLMD